VIDYWRPVEGVIKKQMKIVSNSQEEFDGLQMRLQQITNIFSEHVIKTVNTTGKRRTIFKDDRKITVGTSRKDIMNCRGKVKKAFMNCFALILRFQFEGAFREMHVKVFNTGKLEIPGILSNAILDKMKERILATIQPHLNGPVDFVENAKVDNVLINSNFNCGFCINKDRLYAILRGDKYGIEITNDPCHYPGLKCKYYYKTNLPMDHPDQNGQLYKEDRGQKLSELETSQRYVKASFMIFRTGSCLILGNCSEEVIQHIFVFLRRLLQEEYEHIVAPNEQPMNKVKKTKPRKKQLTMSGTYYDVLSASSRGFANANPTSTI
jgi:TATA-box binding protein (TBP) (component of TFIID and TFIIIB)